MKKNLVLSAIFALGILGTSLAQVDVTPTPKAKKEQYKGAKGRGKGKHAPKKSALERAKHKTNKLNEKIGLSADQQAKITNIYQDHILQADKIKEANTGNKESDLQKSRKEAREKVLLVLTPEQQAKWKQGNKNHENQWKGKGKGKAKLKKEKHQEEDED